MHLYSLKKKERKKTYSKPEYNLINASNISHSFTTTTTTKNAKH